MTRFRMGGFELHPFEKKIPRHHPQVQDRTMSVDGFTDFAYKAFDPRYEKSAAPLSKRRNGIGRVHNLGFVGASQSAYKFAGYAFVMLGAYYYRNKLTNELRTSSKDVAKFLKRSRAIDGFQVIINTIAAIGIVRDIEDSAKQNQ